jgi:hypothetical protein
LFESGERTSDGLFDFSLIGILEFLGTEELFVLKLSAEVIAYSLESRRRTGIVWAWFLVGAIKNAIDEVVEGGDARGSTIRKAGYDEGFRVTF